MGRKVGLLPLLYVIVCLASINTYVEASAVLDVPPRRQWENNQGYCGSCSVQQVALYYGTYVSQYVCRAIIDPDQSEQVLVGVNMSTLLDALSLKYESWNYEIHPPPQYQDYLVWCTQHLNNRAPVIITAYIRGMSDPDYDHIMVAIGFNANDPNSYDDNNQIIYNDCFSSSSFTRSFGSLYDDRRMQGNGAVYEYCIPKQYDYGCAVTGIKDIDNETFPVHLHVDSWDEPNITMGAAPKQLGATLKISSLAVGNPYLILRYDDYLKVPSRDFEESDFDSSRGFVATNSTHYFTDQFMSDRAIIYRCIADLGPPYVDPFGICGGQNPCYRSIQEAVNVAETGAVIRIAQGTYNESVFLNESKSLTLKGGWNSSFSAQTPNTTYIKAPKVTQGSMTLQIVTIRAQQ